MTATLAINHNILEEASNMLKAVAHPARISIVSLLQNGEKLSVTEIYEALNIEQASASHHLTTMKDRGVLIAERDGKNIFYSLKYPKLSQIVDCITECCENN